MRFKPVFIEGTTLGDTWFQLLLALNEHGRRYKITKGSYEGCERLAFDFVSGTIKYPYERPLAPIMPEGLPSVTTDEKIEEYFINYLLTSKREKTEHYKYSSWIIGDKELCPYNQMEWIINHFKKFGYGTEHCFIQIGNPTSNLAYDAPYKTEQDRGTSPCLRGLDYRIIENYLVLHVIYRSWDLVSAWCENIGGFARLTETIAEELEIKPGPISFSCKSLHAYDFAVDTIRKRLGK